MWTLSRVHVSLKSAGGLTTIPDENMMPEDAEALHLVPSLQVRLAKYWIQGDKQDTPSEILARMLDGVPAI